MCVRVVSSECENAAKNSKLPFGRTGTQCANMQPGGVCCVNETELVFHTILNKVFGQRWQQNCVVLLFVFKVTIEQITLRSFSLILAYYDGLYLELSETSFSQKLILCACAVLSVISCLQAMEGIFQLLLYH